MDNSIVYIPLNELIPGEFHPHLENTPDNLDNLTNSIKNYGILIPLIVRPKDKKYEIILGNRRYKVAKKLGLAKVPTIISNVDDKKALELIISDNIQRKELTSKEEANLYEQALSYPNTNAEKLSINLGIPLDRITSKLNLLKKEKNIMPKEHIKENSNNYDNQNNSINNDVINLSKLNKEEKERDDYNMNNNQFINNDITNNQNNNQGVSNVSTQEQNQGPTFGGRFFPSLEDEPTNMNLNTNFNNSTIDPNSSPLPTGVNSNLNNEPLIDLTDLSSISQTNSTPLASAQSINIPTPSPVTSTIPEVPPINESIISSSLPNINLSQYNDSNLTPQNPQSINNDLNQSSVNLNSPIDISNLSPINNPLSNEPIIDNNISIPNIDISTTPTPNPETIPNLNQDINNYTNPSLERTQSNPIPTIEQSSINIENIPNLTNEIDPNSQLATPININQANITSQTKDVIPIVNMIKNLAISIESLGYKLIINETDEATSYKITIEVEK